MDKIRPILLDSYPELEGKIPWIPLLTNLPSKVERNLNNIIELEDA